ncbi:hypothetical protein WFZ85_12620 [Flavobacterium sp. j3]|uniref:Uncharacterized protein n=1 Tax=Flavobacterium aureirubrum TaxID=3133147 RepID=A0ABU9N6Z1_9FLAO
MKKIDLELKLRSFRDNEKNSDLLLQVEKILNDDENSRTEISNKLSTKNPSKAENALVFDLLKTENIYHLSHIEKICVDYRLRFLDSNLFKNTIPEEAISKIKNLEKEHQTNLSGFKIVAPSKAFHLVNYDDPLLFVPIGNNYYYLIHKWGDEMNSFRKLMVLPLKSLRNFTIFTVILSVLVTLVIPQSNLSKSVPLAPVIIFLFTFKSIFAILGYFFFMVGKNFNTEIWQRKYYNN